MRITLWGTRGSLASPSPETTRYGGNTSCVQVEAPDGTTLVLDAGTGIRRLGMQLSPALQRVDLLLTHLHMDHLQGLGFFAPLYKEEVEVHIWGPASTTMSLRSRLTRYLSPPLFPVWLRELPCQLSLHEVPFGTFKIGPFQVSAALVCHPGPTVGYRIISSGRSVAYLPDHEPALGVRAFPLSPSWTSGYALAEGCDLLVHDAQYTEDEYRTRQGWGHSSIEQALKFATLAGVKQFVAFHHDPSHTDEMLDHMMAEAVRVAKPPLRVTPGTEGTTFQFSA